MPLYLREEDVHQVLDEDPYFTGMVETLETAFRDYAAGGTITPSQERTRLISPLGATVRPYERDIRILPAMLPSMNAAGVRIGAGKDGRARCSYTILMDFDTMRTLAFIEDHHMHAVRSGVPAGLATRHLAKQDASVLAVVGCGRISRIQLASTLGQRNIQAIRVYRRSAEPRADFAKEHERRFNLPVEASESVEAAVTGADIVVCATRSHNAPALHGAWVAEGCLVASATPGEADAATALRGRTILSSRNRIRTDDVTPQEPIASLIKDGTLDLDKLPLLGEVLNGTAAGRQSESEVVFFFDAGIGFGDVAAARYVYDLAVAKGLGSDVPG